MLGPYYVNNEARRRAAWGPFCQVPFASVTIAGKTLKCHRLTLPVWIEFERIRAKHGYEAPGTDTGFYNCRHIGNDPSRPWSAHASASALDLNWLQNPAGKSLVTDMPPEMIKELQALRTVSGVFALMWGGDWDRDPRTNHTFWDAMHWEVIAHPLDIATSFVHGLPLVSIPTEGHDMALKKGDRGNACRAIQKELNRWSLALQLVEDGIFGLRTEVGLKQYQQAADLPQSGVADPLALSFLLTTRGRNA